MDMNIPPLKIMLESNPLKSIMLVQKLSASPVWRHPLYPRCTPSGPAHVFDLFSVCFIVLSVLVPAHVPLHSAAAYPPQRAARFVRRPLREGWVMFVGFLCFHWNFARVRRNFIIISPEFRQNIDLEHLQKGDNHNLALPTTPLGPFAWSGAHWSYGTPRRARVSQKCTSKGRWRRGIVLKRRNSLQKEPMPCRHMPLLV